MTETSTTTDTTVRPTWDQVWARIGSEDMLAAKALIELSPTLRADAGEYLLWFQDQRWDDDDTVETVVYPSFDDVAWINDVEESGRGWSSTEHRLFEIVASLLDPERQIHLRRVLGYMGSWETAVWQILVTWGTGGNNREHLGRARVVTR